MYFLFIIVNYNNQQFTSYISPFEKDYYLGLIVDNYTTEYECINNIILVSNKWSTDNEVYVNYTLLNPIIYSNISIYILTSESFEFHIISSNSIITIEPSIFFVEKSGNISIPVVYNFTDFVIGDSSLNSVGITIIHTNLNYLFDDLHINVIPKMLDCRIEDISYTIGTCSSNKKETSFYYNKTCSNGYILPAQDYIPCCINIYI